MTEPWTTKGAATRARIIDTAADLIYRRGIDGVGINDIRSATSTSHGQIFHYFPDGRAQLLREVVVRQTRQALDDQRPHLDALDTPETWVAWKAQLIAVHRARGARGGCPLGSLAPQLSETDDEARALITAGLREWSGYFEHGLFAMQDHGRLRAGTDVPALSRSILSTVQGGLLQMQATRSLEMLSISLDAVLRSLDIDP